jgi:hypothetical protein
MRCGVSYCLCFCDKPASGQPRIGIFSRRLVFLFFCFFAIRSYFFLALSHDCLELTPEGFGVGKLAPKLDDSLKASIEGIYLGQDAFETLHIESVFFPEHESRTRTLPISPTIASRRSSNSVGGCLLLPFVGAWAESMAAPRRVGDALAEVRTACLREKTHVHP